MVSISEDSTRHAHEVGVGHGTPRPFTRLRHLLQPERREIVTIVVFTAAVAVLSLAAPIAVESLVNTVAFGVLMWPVVAISGVLMACLGLAAAIRAMQVYVVESIQQRLFVRVVADYAHRLPRLSLEAFDHRYGPELVNRFFDVLNLQKAVAFLLVDGLSIVVAALVGMIVLAFYHPFLLGFDILLILLIAFILFGLGWGGVSTSLRESHAKYDVAAWLEEMLRCQSAFKFSRGQQFALEKADSLANEYLSARRQHFRVVWRQTVFALGLQVVVSTALLGLGGWLVINRQLTLGQLVAAELIVSLVVASVAKLGKYADTYYDLMAAAEKLGLVTDLPMEPEDGEKLGGGVGMAIRVQGLHRVSQRNLPSSANWSVSSNEKVALVAPSASGKTTVFEVLCGLREPGQGTVQLDGIDIRGLSLEHLRSQVALVEKPEIFVGTVLENMRLGRSELSPSEVRETLRVVGLLDVVNNLPQGLNTLLNSDGKPLSASQAQRLTIARALIGRPRLLILDGVLDSLDHRECPELLSHLFDRSAPWTLLIASANPEIVGRCDRVIRSSPTGASGDHRLNDVGVDQ